MGPGTSSQQKMHEARRTRSGCQHCRLRHLRCDDQQPQCSRCVAAGITCIRGLSIRFQHRLNPSVTSTGESSIRGSRFGFNQDQPWCRTNHPLAFVDETRDLLSLYDNVSDVEALDQRTGSSPVGSASSDCIYASTPANDTCLDSPQSRDLTRPAKSACATGVEDTDWAESSPKRRRIHRTDSFNSVNLEPLPQLTFPEPAHVERPIPCGDESEGLSLSALPALGCPSLGLEPSDLLPTTTIIEEEVAISAEPKGKHALTQADTVPSPQLGVSTWPLQNEVEASLFRYFVDYVARCFDLCDPERHFALIVPCRAIMCYPLMNAIFAVSAKHLSRTSSFDKDVSDEYYQKCLSTLVPMLGDASALMDENLFAATVILRNFEEVEVPLSGADSSTHLLGNNLFVKASAAFHDSGGSFTPSILTGLRRAAFLVAVRQEIYTAFVSQRSVSPSFSSCVIERSVDVEADDCTWANHIVFHVVDVLRFCFEEDESMDASRTAARYDELMEYGRQWYEKKPISFCPIYYRSGDRYTRSEGAGSPPADARKGPFPAVWLLSDAVATGMQHYHLSRILLLAFDPRAPRIGPNRARFMKQQTEHIKEEVRILVGMAKSNPQCHPNYATACMGIAMAGERFEQQWEQEALIDFLKETEAVCAWPTVTAQRHLSEAWGWEDP